MPSFVHPETGTYGRGWAWESPSSDPNDETFGDVTELCRSEDAGAFGAVLVGEPYDGAVIGRSGAADGPGAIRECLASVKTHSFEAGPIGPIGDLGDVGFLAGSPDRRVDTDDVDGCGGVQSMQTRLRAIVDELHALDSLPVFLGGDNSLTYPNVAPLVDRTSVGVVTFDAHLDVREVREDATSGTPYRQLFEAGLDGYVCVGARHHETSTAYADYLADRGGDVVTSEMVDRDLEGTLRRIREAVDGVDALYVSVDCDVLDAAAAPGVSAPTPGGLFSRELFWLVRQLAADDRVAGMEVVECAPPLDEGGRTVDAAARAVAHFLAGADVGGDRRGGS